MAINHVACNYEGVMIKNLGPSRSLKNFVFKLGVMSACFSGLQHTTHLVLKHPKVPTRPGWTYKIFTTKEGHGPSLQKFDQCEFSGVERKTNSDGEYPSLTPIKNTPFLTPDFSTFLCLSFLFNGWIDQYPHSFSLPLTTRRLGFVTRGVCHVPRGLDHQFLVGPSCWLARLWDNQRTPPQKTKIHSHLSLFLSVYLFIYIFFFILSDPTTASIMDPITTPKGEAMIACCLDRNILLLISNSLLTVVAFFMGFQRQSSGFIVVLYTGYSMAICTHCLPFCGGASFDAQSLCVIYSDCSKTSKYAKRWSLDESLAEACSMPSNYLITPFRGVSLVSSYILLNLFHVISYEEKFRNMSLHVKFFISTLLLNLFLVLLPYFPFKIIVELMNIILSYHHMLIPIFFIYFFQPFNLILYQELLYDRVTIIPHFNLLVTKKHVSHQDINIINSCELRLFTRCCPTIIKIPYSLMVPMELLSTHTGSELNSHSSNCNCIESLSHLILFNIHKRNIQTSLYLE
ncbi:hypothetical protein VP01_1212g2 [Puccinia sorghi]|uniref:Uncharacterized protein n=1 Tax=Puccinia sorghi TaxID=27349 RepID=A0A0L6VRR5_9BASI|nr:hypothetical protein VP01_1212g2 [Puccinia sorghi]